jgi:hypothetical protein
MAIDPTNVGGRGCWRNSQEEQEETVMSGGYDPYLPPKTLAQETSAVPPPRVTSLILPPAIVLLVIAILGILLALANVVYALTVAVPQPNPQLPDWINEMQRSSVGPAAAAFQVIWIILHSITLAGSIMQMRLSMRGLAIAGTILAMLNFASCCCVLGLPVGIWNLIVLFNPNVQRAFAAR